MSLLNPKNWFKPKYNVCKQCGVLFEPPVYMEKKYSEYCEAHRKDIIEKDLKRSRVLSWAESNFLSLYEQMRAEEEKYSAEFKGGAIAAANQYNSRINDLGKAGILGADRPKTAAEIDRDAVIKDYLEECMMKGQKEISVDEINRDGWLNVNPRP